MAKELRASRRSACDEFLPWKSKLGRWCRPRRARRARGPALKRILFLRLLDARLRDVRLRLKSEASTQESVSKPLFTRRSSFSGRRSEDQHWTQFVSEIGVAADRGSGI